MNTRQPPIEEARARELLRRERERIEGSLADLERVRSSGLDERETETELAADSELIEEEEVDDALATQLEAELRAVERAEKRLEDGSYGFSVESGEPIPAQRLQTIPWAERTQEEQERYERTHGSSL
jgi:DnaK suppressor protein